MALAPAAFVPRSTGWARNIAPAGHEVFLIVPGQRAERAQLYTGVVRITLPARLIPFTGGYRAVMPGRSRRCWTRCDPTRWRFPIASP